MGRDLAPRAFLISNDQDWGILIFGTLDCLLELFTASTVYMDRTFLSCLPLYDLVFTILADVNGHIPIVTAIMEHKGVGDYRFILRKDGCRKAVDRCKQHVRPARRNSRRISARLSTCLPKQKQ